MFDINKMLTIDNTGMPKIPDIKQIQDKDVMLLFTRDKTYGKEQYIKEVGVIYYFGDPQSPARQQGLSDGETLALAIENYNLPKTYTPDQLVKKLIDKYYNSNIGEAGLAVDALHKSIHLISIATNKINEIISVKLANAISDEDITIILSLANRVNDHIKELPNLLSSLKKAKENLRDEREEKLGRGKQVILSSMDADDY